MRIFRYIPRWLPATISLALPLSMIIGVVVVVTRAANAGYACLTDPTNYLYTSTLDTASGQIFTTNLIDPKSEAAHQGIPWQSPVKTKLALNWHYNAYEQFIAMVDLRTRQTHTIKLDNVFNLSVKGWSADGKYLAVNQETASGEILLTIFDTSTMQTIRSTTWRPLTPRFENVYSAMAWSPQGRQFAQLSADSSNIGYLTLISPDRPDEKTVTLPGDLTGGLGYIFPVWSPDSRYIALSDYHNIWLYDTRTSALQKVSDHADLYNGFREIDRLRWSPDSKTLFYIEAVELRSNNLVAYYPETSSHRTLATNWVYLIRFSPDLKYALILNQNSDEMGTFRIVNVDSGQDVVLKSNGMWIRPNDVIWSADNSTMTLTLANGLVWARTDGSAQYQVSDMSDFSMLYSHNEQIVYESLQVDGYSVGLLDVKTGERRVFKSQPTKIFDAILSPDSRILALTTWAGLGQRDVKVTLVSVDGSWSKTFETNSGDVARVLWSPDSTTLAVYTASNVGQRTLHILRADGTVLRQIDNLPENFYLDHWTNCGSGL